MGLDLGGHEEPKKAAYYTFGPTCNPWFPLDPNCRNAENTGRRTSKEHRVGKGDKRTFRGKVFKGSHGKTRPRKAKKKRTKRPA
jgi:ribosomal small subunit protein bTHX